MRVESDEKIAKRILTRKLRYVRYQSGAIGIATSEKLHRDDVIDEDEVRLIVKSNAIGKGLTGLKKRVQRIRREMIEEGTLSKEYAPRPYRRD